MNKGIVFSRMTRYAHDNKERLFKLYSSKVFQTFVLFYLCIALKLVVTIPTFIIFPLRKIFIRQPL